MFENGNYRRRRRMKRPYRTGSHFQKIFGDSYGNFAPRGVFPQPAYQTYQPRYDTRWDLKEILMIDMFTHWLICSPWMSSSQLATYNSCTSRSGYTYSTPLQQPVQSVSLINNSYSGLPNSISGEINLALIRTFNNTKIIFADYYPLSVPQSTSSPSLPCSSAPRRFDTSSHALGGQFYNWDHSRKISN